MPRLELCSAAVGARGGGEGVGAGGSEGSYCHKPTRRFERFEIRICIKVKLSGLVKYSSKYAKELSY